MKIPLKQRTKGGDEERFVYVDKKQAGGGSSTIIQKNL
jgi:hypothetical protein